MMREKLFISYSHKDIRWFERVREQLAVLEQEGLIDAFDDTRIRAGEDWYARLDQEMREAQIALFLISASFLTSAFIRKEEIPRLFERHEAAGMILYPLLVRDCPWQEVSWLARLQIRPRDARPIARMTASTLDKCLADVAREIASIVRAGSNQENKSDSHSSPTQPSRRLATLTNDVLSSLHELDNTIRKTVGPLTRFDHTWSNDAREKTIKEMGVLSDEEVILPKLRQLLAELEAEEAKGFNISPEGIKAVDVVLACGRATLQSLGESDVTPWPGPHELSEVMYSIRTVDTPEGAESVRHSAQEVLAIVDRKLLREADKRLGHFKGNS
jgi:hypothetical protein